VQSDFWYSVRVTDIKIRALDLRYGIHYKYFPRWYSPILPDSACRKTTDRHRAENLVMVLTLNWRLRVKMNGTGCARPARGGGWHRRSNRCAWRISARTDGHLPGIDWANRAKLSVGDFAGNMTPAASSGCNPTFHRWLLSGLVLLKVGFWCVDTAHSAMVN
jgi:hypothetical protein